jgi:hypothetical protein
MGGYPPCFKKAIPRLSTGYPEGRGHKSPTKLVARAGGSLHFQSPAVQGREDFLPSGLN